MSPGQKRYIHIPSRPALAPAFNPAKTLFLALAASRQAVSRLTFSRSPISRYERPSACLGKAIRSRNGKPSIAVFNRSSAESNGAAFDAAMAASRAGA